jgi:CSLREA domain-containing protein
VLLTALVVAATTPAAADAARPLTVDTREDSFDGSCTDGDCSLRDAVKSAPTGERVSVPSGFYPLSITGAGGVGEGTIELRRGIEIVGEGETGAFIDASALGMPAFAAERSRNPAARLSLEHLTIFGARDASLAGGAISVESGRLSLIGVTVVGGLADRGGGIAIAAGARLRLVRSLVIENEAATTGGGVWNEGMLTALRSAIVGNVATDGGGLWTGPGSATSIANVTVADNTATGDGGGLWLAGPTEIIATTIGGNIAGRGGGISARIGSIGAARTIVSANRAGRARGCDGTLRSFGDNIDQGHRCGFDTPRDLEEVDARLRPLGPNGGPTPTMALTASSPAVGIAGNCEGRDQRGVPRARRCDAGAYEIVRCLGLIVNIVGTPDDDELSGGRGNDAFLGMGGNDEFQGSVGADSACGGGGRDLLIAGPGRDRFSGEAGNDRVKGESGDDLLYGGPGRDLLTGGPGRDTCEVRSHDRRARGCELAT